MSSSNSNGGIHKSTGHEIFPLLPMSQCVPWIVAITAESLAIFTLNIITIISFLRQHHLQRGSLYLIIHLAIVDLLVGTISAPMLIERVGIFCFAWPGHPTFSLLLRSFPVASIINLVIVALERAFATFRPLKHRCLRRRVFYVAIFSIWLLVVIREAICLTALLRSPTSNARMKLFLELVPWGISLFIIWVSYISIFVKIRFSPHPNPLHNGMINRERRLTLTLFAALLVSLLMWLPLLTFLFLETFFYKILLSLSLSSYFHFTVAVHLFLLTNSLANPIIYAIRMPSFRAELRNSQSAALELQPRKPETEIR